METWHWFQPPAALQKETTQALPWSWEAVLERRGLEQAALLHQQLAEEVLALGTGVKWGTTQQDTNMCNRKIAQLEPVAVQLRMVQLPH